MDTKFGTKLDGTSPMTEYLTLPKNIGDVPSERLFAIARQSLECMYDDSRIQLEHVTQPALIAASALVEGVLTEANGSIDKAETHLGILDFAEELYRQVSEAEYRKLEEGFNHPDNQEAWLRAELQRAFMDVYRDMACGEVTLDRTKPDILDRLAKLANHVRLQMRTHHGHHDHYREMVGLQGELVVLMKHWQDYKRDGEIIALPATYRGGSGHYNSRETHDIVFAQQSLRHADEGMWNFTNREVKRGNKRLRLDDLIRYDSALIQVGYGKQSTPDSIREVA